MKNCLQCGEPVVPVKGKREKKFCNETCRSNFWYKKNKKGKPKKEEAAKEEIVELKVGDNKAWAKAFKGAGVKATPSGATRKPYMSDAIKKKLGIK